VIITVPATWLGLYLTKQHRLGRAATGVNVSRKLQFSEATDIDSKRYTHEVVNFGVIVQSILVSGKMSNTMT
jgi:hypothetical protein